MTIQLALTPDGQWSGDVADIAQAARRAGFTASGIGADRIDTEAVSDFRRAGLRCHEVMALVLTADREAALTRAAQLAEKAALIGAPWILTTFRAGLTPEVIEIIRHCAAIYAEAGARMAAEFSPLGPFTSITAGLEVVNLAGEGRAGLVVDTWHFSHGDSTWEELERLPLEQIAYVQFADALTPITDDRMYETMHRRALPGDGVLPLERFANTLLDRGWDGIVSVEVLSDELRSLPVADAIGRAYTTTAPYWTGR